METILFFLQGLLGIGLLIFVHEAGHFIAARWCKVDVFVFSLGFGPRLWGFERRGCDYRISAIPVGGYVRMAGELGSEDEAYDGALSSKPAWQRLFVYSGGVLMNILVALILFPLVYTIGVPLPKPIIAGCAPGSPAWSARIPAGSIVRSINGTPIRSFDQILPEVALANPPVLLVVDAPKLDGAGGYERREYTLAPVLDPEDLVPQLGVHSGVRRREARASDGTVVLGYEVDPSEESAAYAAGLRPGDLLVEFDHSPVSDSTPERMVKRALESKAPASVRFVAGPQSPSRTPAEAARLAAVVELTPAEVAETSRPRVGARHAATVVSALLPHPAWTRAGVETGDRWVSLDGAAIADTLPLRAALRDGKTAKLEFVRKGEWKTASLHLLPGEAADLGEYVALESEKNIIRVEVVPDSPAERAGLQTGDVVLRAGGADIREWSEFETAAAAAARSVGTASAPAGTLDVEIERSSADKTERIRKSVRVEPRAMRDFGIPFVADRETFRAGSPVEAVTLGFDASIRLTKQILTILKKIILGQLAAKKQLGGPISIAAVSIQSARNGWIQFLMLLAQLSLNLAVLNVLPIPVLDGGNLFFVLVEAVKGSPVSERVLGASQTVGLFLLIALMLWVTFRDVQNVFGVLR